MSTARALCWTGENYAGDLGWDRHVADYAAFYTALGAQVDILHHPTRDDMLDAHRNQQYDFLGMIGHGSGGTITIRQPGMVEGRYQTGQYVKPSEIGALLTKPVTFTLTGHVDQSWPGAESFIYCQRNRACIFLERWESSVTTAVALSIPLSRILVGSRRQVCIGTNARRS
jgi:hypothetical protein